MYVLRQPAARHSSFFCARAARIAARLPYDHYAPHNPAGSSTYQRTYTTRPPRKDTRPKSEETTQTDFGQMDIYANMPVPTSGIDACTVDGFSLNSGMRVTESGVMIVGGEAFKWKPWIREGRRKLLNEKGQWEVESSAWGLLDVVWPKPDLLVIGTGSTIAPLSPTTRQHLSKLGIRLEISDTRNAAAQFNLLATERGVQQVAAALVPIGWKERR